MPRIKIILTRMAGESEYLLSLVSDEGIELLQEKGVVISVEEYEVETPAEVEAAFLAAQQKAAERGYLAKLPPTSEDRIRDAESLRAFLVGILTPKNSQN